MARKDVLIDVGMFDLSMPALQECELSYRICLKYKVEILKDILVDYYIYPNISGQITSSLEKNKRALSRISCKYKNELNKLLPDQVRCQNAFYKKRRDSALPKKWKEERVSHCNETDMEEHIRKWEKMEYCLTYVLDYPQIIRLKCKLKEKKVN